MNQPQKLPFVCTENGMRGLTAEKTSGVSVRLLPRAVVLKIMGNLVCLIIIGA